MASYSINQRSASHDSLINKRQKLFLKLHETQESFAEKPSVGIWNIYVKSYIHVLQNKSRWCLRFIFVGVKPSGFSVGWDRGHEDNDEGIYAMGNICITRVSLTYIFSDLKFCLFHESILCTIEYSFMFILILIFMPLKTILLDRDIQFYT